MRRTAIDNEPVVVTICEYCDRLYARSDISYPEAHLRRVRKRKEKVKGERKNIKTRKRKERKRRREESMPRRETCSRWRTLSSSPDCSAELSPFVHESDINKALDRSDRTQRERTVRMTVAEFVINIDYCVNHRDICQHLSVNERRL